MRTITELKQNAIAILDKRISEIEQKLYNDDSINLNDPWLSLLDGIKQNSQLASGRTSREDVLLMEEYSNTETTIRKYATLLNLRDRYETEDPRLILQKLLELE